MKQKRLEKEKQAVIQSLIQSEENLRAIFESASEAFILTDTTGTIRDFNNRAKESIFEITERYISKGQSVFEYIEELRKEYLGLVIAKILRDETVQYDKLYISTKGETHWINYPFKPVKKDHQITGICITGHNITEKKLAEQQKEFSLNNLHALINNTHDLIWSVNRSFNLITSNQSFDDMVQMLSEIRPQVQPAESDLPTYSTGLNLTTELPKFSLSREMDIHYL